MRKGDLIFVKNKGWLFDRVRKITESEFDHIAIFVSEDEIIEATPTRGVARVNVGKYDQVTHSVCRIKDEHRGELNKMVSYCIDKIGRKYDLLQAISIYILIILGIKRTVNPLDIRNAFVCSELIGQAAEEAGVIFKDGVAIDRLTPADIYNSEKLVKIL